MRGTHWLYLEAAFGVNADGTIPEPVPAIMDLCAERDIVFDCGHVEGWEAVALVREAKQRGRGRVRAGKTVQDLTPRIRAAGERAIALSDAGI